jgi:hypothetical protein
VSACGASLAAKKLSVQSGRAVLRLRGTGHGSCSGKLRLRVKLELGHHRTMLKTIGTAVFSLSAGRTVSVKVKLNAAGRRKLRADGGHINASLLIVKSSPVPARSHTASVKLTRVVAHKKKS